MTKSINLAKFAAEVPTSIGSAGQVLKVNSGASAYEWGDGLPAGATAGKVLQRNAGNSAYEWGDGLPTGATAGQVLKRNSGNSAYEWGSAGLNLPSSTTAAQFLTVNAAGNGYEWVERPSIYLPEPDMFSGFASPTNTYATSGTWSKGAVDGTTGVWMYLLGGGGGGGNRGHTGNGGGGGNASLVYLTAAQWDGATYVIGTGGAGGANGSQSGSGGTATTITLSSGNGGTVYTSNSINVIYPVPAAFAAPSATAVGITLSAPNPHSAYSISIDIAAGGQTGTPIGSYFGANGGDHGGTGGHHSVIGGGGGSGHSQGYNGQGIGTPGTSIFAGNGAQNANGIYPGGGASAKLGGGTGYVGAAGNLRAYHV